MGTMIHAVRPRRLNTARLVFIFLFAFALYLTFWATPSVEEIYRPEDTVVYRHDAVQRPGQPVDTARHPTQPEPKINPIRPPAAEGPLRIDNDAIARGPSSGEPVHVVFAFGTEYVVPAFVAVNSTLVNSREPNRLNLHLLVEEAISARVQRAFTRAFGEVADVYVGEKGGKGNAAAQKPVAHEGEDDWDDSELLPAKPQIIIDPFDVTTVPTVKVWQGPQNLVHPLNYARFQLADIYPSLSKVIYVDPDVVVQGDICEMWDNHLRDNKYVIAAAPSKSEKYSKFILDNSIANVDLNEKYFNAGILMINLRLWKEQDIDKEISRWLQLNREKPVYKFGSQPPLLLTFYRKYEPMSEWWNFRHLGHKLTLNPADIAKAKILHFNGPRKPWRTNGIESYRKYWDLYYNPDATTRSLLVWGFEELQDKYLSSSHKSCFTRPTCRAEAERLQLPATTMYLDADPNKPKFGPLISGFLGDMWKFKQVPYNSPSGYPWRFLWVRKQSDLLVRLSKMKFDWSKVDPTRQIVNFIPGVYQESYSKESLCRNVQKFVARHGRGTPATSGMLDCFIIPEQRAALNELTSQYPDKVWIGKEFQESSGHGIELYAGKSQLPPESDMKARLIQSYVEKPFLVNVLGSERKTDLRLYVVITSFDPLRVFLHPVGQVKVAQRPYSANFSDQFAHISNKVGSAENPYDTSNDELRKERQIDEFKYRLTLEDLAKMMEAEKYRDAWERTEDLIVRTVMAFAQNLGCKSDKYGYPCGAAYQLLGVDVVYDENMVPYLMEVNNDPGWNPYYELRNIKMGTKGGTAVAPATNCKFPFVHEGKKYFKCAEPTGDKTEPWCTTDDQGRWGYCDPTDETFHDQDSLQRVFNVVYGDSLFLAGVLPYNMEYEQAVRERYEALCTQGLLPTACNEPFVRDTVVKMANEMENMGGYRMVFPKKGWRNSHLPLIKKFNGENDNVGHVEETTLHIYDIFTEYFSYDFQDAALYRKG